MWDGITSVDSKRNPIISEGKEPARLVVTNAGPRPVWLRGWAVTAPTPKIKADVEVQLRPGNTIGISACLIRAQLIEDDGPAPSPPFAALGWRIVA
jgi:hypothetical protein